MVRRRIRFVAIFIILFNVLGLAGCKEDPQKGIKRIEEAIDVPLPDDARVEYHRYDEAGEDWYTIYRQYTVVKLKTIPEEFLQKCVIEPTTNSWKSDEFVRHAKGCLVKDKYIPSFNEPWLSNKATADNSQDFLIVYFPESLKIIFFVEVLNSKLV